jgi:hypothetical protein
MGERITFLVNGRLADRPEVDDPAAVADVRTRTIASFRRELDS